MKQKPIRVLIVDDSALVRKVVSAGLGQFPDIEVVGVAPDPYVARDRITELNPDVLTLDIEMPRMDGITFLKLIMQHRPMPVIIMSSLSQAGSEKAFEALQAGAVDVIGKPSGSFSAQEDAFQLAKKIRAAACARVFPIPAAARENRTPAPPPIRKAAEGSNRRFSPRAMILLGASTGGTEALKTVLGSMSGDLPCIFIVQHIPAYFSRVFAERLNQCCAMEVREARQGDLARPGLALVAPGGFHMMLKWNGATYAVDLSQGPPVHYQRPAVEILFDSAVKSGAGPHAVAALLTGMGSDGAAGLRRLRDAGARTIAQNEETSVVFGMPKEAIRLGGAEHVVPLEFIGLRLEQLALNHPTRPSLGTAKTNLQPT